MPRLPDPSEIQSRPASVVLGELAIAAGLVGVSTTITLDFPANVLCHVWKYYARALGSGNVIHVRAMRDLKNFDRAIAHVRAVFVYAPRQFDEVVRKIQMASGETMSPRPAVFCGFQLGNPDSDPGLTLPLVGDERELDAVLAWATTDPEPNPIEVDLPTSVEHDRRLETALHPSAQDRPELGYHEIHIARALVEGQALLRSVGYDDRGNLQATLSDYRFVRELLCSPAIRPNRELCDPQAMDMVNRANVYLSVKLGGDRRNPFYIAEDDGYRRSRNSSVKRDGITRRELADLGNTRSRMLTTLIEYRQRNDAGYAQYIRMGVNGEPIAERRWQRLPARELATRLKRWSIKQVRTHFDRLHQSGLVIATRERSNGPIRYELPEELEHVQAPYSQLPTVRSITRNQPAA